MNIRLRKKKEANYKHNVKNRKAQKREAARIRLKTITKRLKKS
jgi:hypothetical protein